MTWIIDGTLPDMDELVLGAFFDGWGDPEVHQEPQYRFELIQRNVVGKICGDKRTEWTWYNQYHSSAYGQKPERLVAWAPLIAPPVPVETLPRPTEAQYAASRQRSLAFHRALSQDMDAALEKAYRK